MKIVVTYDSEAKIDGTGAQLQRQFGILALSEILGSFYIFSPIKDIAVHPLDPFQSHESYLRFIERLNHEFAFNCDSSLDTKITRTKRILNPSIFTILFLGIMSLPSRGLTLLKICEPYRITETFQDFYDLVPNRLKNWAIPQMPEDVMTIAMHFRQGVGGKAIYPGQKISRELDLDYFIQMVKSIQRESPSSNLRILVLTDAPLVATSYSPPSTQITLWEGTPGYENGVMKIEPFDFSSLNILDCEISIFSGGDPIEAIRIMCCADILLMGRSSLSFVAGVLNENGKVYIAPDFWHNSLLRWY